MQNENTISYTNQIKKSISTKVTMISMGSALINLRDSLPYNLSKPSYGRIDVH